MDQEIIYVTGNTEKFDIGNATCRTRGVKLVQGKAEIDEIQSENSETIIRDKAERAYKHFRKPLVVNDVSWEIPAVNGFPGPYMKFVSRWFSPTDWLNLMKPYEDRRIVLVDYIAYQDNEGCRVFRTEYTGNFIREIRGNYGSSLQKVVTMPGDDGRTIAEIYDHKVQHDTREVAASWRSFLDWYTASVKQPA